MLSRYGCKVVCDGRAKLGSEIYVLHPDGCKSMRARVVYRELTGNTERVFLALEFIGGDNFWQIDFPPPPRAFTVN